MLSTSLYEVVSILNTPACSARGPVHAGKTSQIYFGRAPRLSDTRPITARVALSATTGLRTCHFGFRYYRSRVCSVKISDELDPYEVTIVKFKHKVLRHFGILQDKIFRN
jgi:hypothetical protein